MATISVVIPTLYLDDTYCRFTPTVKTTKNFVKNKSYNLGNTAVLLFYILLIDHIVVGTSDILITDNEILCSIANAMPQLFSQCSCFPCTYSVPCNTSTVCGNVTKIFNCISSFNNTIATQIGQLMSLSYISFGSTHISGTIPTQLLSITNLNYIDLSITQINGTIPTQIGQLKSLTYINFEATLISGTIPTQLLSITNLQYIILSYTQINGTIPTQIGQLKSLTYINFGITHTLGTIPTQLLSITNLQNIILSYTQINGTIPTQIGQLKSLTHIDFSATHISGTIPTQIGQLKSLFYINFESTHISGTIPTQLLTITNLQYIIMNNTQISGTIPTQIGQLKSLSNIDIGFTQLSGTIPTQLSSITSLVRLYMTNTQLYGCLPTSLLLQLEKCLLSCVSFNCTLPPKSNCNQCNNSISYSPGDTPLPSPIIRVNTPLSSPIIGSDTPLPSPIIGGDTPLPSPIIGEQDCYGNYGPVLTCKDGKWISSTDVELNGTNLINGIFYISSLLAIGNVLVSESILNIENNLYIQDYTVFTLQNSSVIVNGNLKMWSHSTILVNVSVTDNFFFSIKNCSFLDGSLIVSEKLSQASTSLLILTSQCINGTFSSVKLNLLTETPCNTIVPHVNQLKDSISVTFEFVNGCFALWEQIIIGFSGFGVVFAGIGVIILIKRKHGKREKKINEIGLAISNPQVPNVHGQIKPRLFEE